MLTDLNTVALLSVLFVFSVLFVLSVLGSGTSCSAQAVAAARFSFHLLY
jgi:hypothetical protein